MQRLTSHERVERIFRGEAPDRVPFDIPFIFPEFRESWARYMGLPGEMLEDHCQLDCLEVAADHSPWPSRARIVEEHADGRIGIDGFGRTYREQAGTGVFEILEVPLAEKRDLETLEFEPPAASTRYARMEETFRAKRERFWVYAKVGGPYSRSKNLRGEERFLMDMASDEAFVRELVAKVTDLMIAVGLESVRRLGLKTAIHVHDDFAATKSLLFSPRIYEKIFLPAMAMMACAFHAAGVHVIYGGEGRTGEILPWLADAGFDAFTCLEPRAGNDIVELRRKLGERPVFFGNMCNTIVLPRGSRGEIREMVVRQMRIAREGGCIVGPSHSVAGDMPPANFEYLWRLIHEYAPWDAPLP